MLSMPPVRLFTSESVSEGHPDKLADQISDAILDECLKDDPESRCAIETLLGMGFAVITGEVRTETYVDIAKVVRNIIQSVGYDDMKVGMDGRTCGVLVSVHEQSEDIAQGVDIGGAGDQGMMFGYACNETPQMMPLPIAMAHAMMKRQAQIKRRPELGFLPDAKCQITIAYESGKPKYVDTVVCSCQQSEEIPQNEFHQRVREHLIDPTLEEFAHLVDIRQHGITYHINPTGAFFKGGPEADSGLTGRKIIVDTYGGFCPHGGGAFSGKDPSKVDRSAAYMARHAAKCIVAAGLAEKAQISLAYAIGVSEPVQITVETFGTEKIAPEIIEQRVRDTFSFSPIAISEHLGLRKGFKYLPTAKNGHFGHEEFPWENTQAAHKLVGETAAANS